MKNLGEDIISQHLFNVFSHCFQIFLLLFLALFLVSYAILKRYKRDSNEEYYSMDRDEITVYRISTGLCTFSLAVSIGALLLLPISIVSNEVLIIYANSYYIKWLNSSLIQGKLKLLFYCFVNYPFELRE